MFEDFRGFLCALEEKGLLKRVTREVDPVFEIAAGIRKISDGSGPALLFENVKGYPGWKVVGGIFGNRRLLAAAAEVEEDQLLQKHLEWQEKRMPPLMVTEAPCQEIVRTGQEIDVRQLPLCVHSERDPGPYITAALHVGKHPKTGVRNLSLHRMFPLGRDKLTLWAAPDRHLRRFIMDAEQQGKGLEVATIIGVEPLIQLASQAKVPLGVDEYEVAGGMRGQPVELVKCKTIDVEVPAHAEIVIEGVTVPHELVPDGPFGEYPGTYSEAKQAPTVRVTAITMRRNAIYQTALTGMPLTENHWMIKYWNEAAVWQMARAIVPELVAVNVTGGGSARHHVVIALKKKHEAEARNVILAVLSNPSVGIKRVVVVDDDIDVQDPSDVEWAINTRCQPDKDVIIIPSLASGTLDPSAPASRTTAKWGIDATMPLRDNEGFRKVYVPGQEGVDYV